LHDIASSSGIHVGSVATIIHEHLLFKKVCAWCVPKMLMFNQKELCVVYAEHLHWWELEKNTFIE
jgi:hypothetical protein